MDEDENPTPTILVYQAILSRQIQLKFILRLLNGIYHKFQLKAFALKSNKSIQTQTIIPGKF